jgi:multiple antibiotic resistance protein
MTIWQIALALFLIMNVLGHLPPIIALVKDYDLKKQRQILLKEALYAFLIGTFYLFFGDWFLGTLHIERYTMSTAGGTILLLVALQMIFPPTEEALPEESKREPCIVPIATPMLAGGGFFTTTVYLSVTTGNTMLVWVAMMICCAVTAVILYFAPFAQKLIGKRGLVALEQLMGMVIVMMALSMMVKGLQGFILAGKV